MNISEGRRILAIDSSAVSASCAVTYGDRLVSQSFVNVGLTHSETLLTLISNTLGGADMSLADIDHLAVSSGPGSFTGIRIGVSTVKGLAFTEQKPCVGVSTLEAICCGIYGIFKKDGYDGTEAVICPVMDARRDQVYNALFALSARDGSQAAYPQRLCPDRALPVEELALELESGYNDKIIWLCGDGAELVWSMLSGRFGNMRLAPVQVRYQTGYGVAAAALRMIEEGKAVAPERLVPAYLRPSQAERELAERLSDKRSGQHNNL